MASPHAAKAPTSQPHRWLASVAIGLATMACLLPAQAARIVGYVRDANTQRYLYTEVHEQNLATDGAVQTGLTTYYDAQGVEIARKTLDYRSHRTVPLYRMDIPASRYAEGISANSPQVVIFKRDKGDEERKTLPLEEGLVAADAGFNQLLQDQLLNIGKGATIKFQLIVAGHTNRYSFRAKKVSDATPDGQATMHVLVEPDSLLRLLVPSISLRYDMATRRLLSYQGVSNILDPDTQQVYKHIRIDYGGSPPRDVKLPPQASDAR